MGKVAPKSTLDRLCELYRALFTETPEGTYYTQSGEKECECPT